VSPLLLLHIGLQLELIAGAGMGRGEIRPRIQDLFPP